jgi:hypothetical protein
MCILTHGGADLGWERLRRGAVRHVGGERERGAKWGERERCGGQLRQSGLLKYEYGAPTRPAGGI